MDKVKTYAVFFLVALLSPAMLQGQNAAEVIQASVVSDLPSIPGAAIISRPAVDGGLQRKEFVAVVSQAGTYLSQWEDCQGRVVWLNETVVPEVSKGGTANLPIVNIEQLLLAAPLLPSPCKVNLFRMEGGGHFSQLSALVSPAAEPIKVWKEFFDSDGRYGLEVSGSIAANSTVVLGGKVFATHVANSLFTETRVLFSDLGQAPEQGATSLTVCSQGVCNSTTYTRVLSVVKK